MALTPTQYATLKANIAADPVLDALPLTDDANFAIADAYNLPASPAFRVWKTLIKAKDVKQSVVWTEFIARSTGERDAFQFMLSDGSINAADANVRQGIQDIFSGAGGATSRANLIALAKRDATRMEKLFAVGTGSDASPAAMMVEGPLSYQDVSAARNS